MLSTVKAKWIMDKMEIWAPSETAEKWDNVGLLVGDAEQPVIRVLTALDATEDVIAKAVSEQYDWIITHHPMLFNPINKITTCDITGRKIITLIKNNIGMYAAHTNLDMAEGGTNDILFEKLALTGKAPLMEAETESGLSLGRVGCLPQTMRLSDFAAYIKQALSLPNIRYVGEPDTSVFRAALCAGDASASRYWQAALTKGCDVYITGDLRHHGAQDAMEAGLSLIDITHYAGESPVVEAMAAYLRREAAAAGLILEITAYTEKGAVFKTI